MALITFTSDYGLEDHYVAAVKAKILNSNPNAVIVDISHSIEASNLIHASIVISSVLEDFPEGSIHLIAVNSHRLREPRFLIAKVKGRILILPDNGLISLITEEQVNLILEIPIPSEAALSFPGKNIMAQIAGKLSLGADLEKMGKIFTDPQRALNLRPKAGKSGINGQVIHVDHYGNVHTNIRKNVFEDILKLVSGSFELTFSNERLHEIKQHYGEVSDGEVLAFFNDLGVLEIAVREGNASQLFGLHYDSPVRIKFL